MASGGAFLKWTTPKPRRVLYVDGEMPAIAMQERFAATITADQPVYVEVNAPVTAIAEHTKSVVVGD